MLNYTISRGLQLNNYWYHIRKKHTKKHIFSKSRCTIRFLPEKLGDALVTTGHKCSLYELLPPLTEPHGFCSLSGPEIYGADLKKWGSAQDQHPESPDASAAASLQASRSPSQVYCVILDIRKNDKDRMEERRLIKMDIEIMHIFISINDCMIITLLYYETRGK